MENNQHCDLDANTGFILHCDNNFLCLSRKRRFTSCFLKSFIQKWYFYASHNYCASSCGWKIEEHRYELIILSNSAIQYKIQVLQRFKFCIFVKSTVYTFVLDFKGSIWFAFASLPFLFDLIFRWMEWSRISTSQAWGSIRGEERYIFIE